MIKYIFSILFILLITSSYSQWTSNFGGPGKGDVNFENAKGNAITTDQSGNSFATGYSFEEAGGNDILTIKYNSAGEIIWAVTFNGTASLDDEGNGICVDQSGNIYVVGASQNVVSSCDITLLKYDQEGTLLWSRIYYSDGAGREDKGLGIALDASGCIYITGYTTNSDSYTDIVLRKYDPEGNPLWTSLEDGSANLDAIGSCVTVSTSGNVYVGGYVTSSGNGTDIFVRKYNSNGWPRWTKTINGGGNSEDRAWGIVVDEEDNLYVGGFVTDELNGTDCYIAKIGNFGYLLWSRTYNGPGNSTDKAWGIVIDEEDNSVYVTGETSDANRNTNYVTMKYDTYGNSGWISEYNGSGNGTDIASAIGIIVNPDNSKSVVVTGKSWGTTETFDYATVRYDISDGSLTQVNTYSMNGLSNDVASDIAITPDNNVLITGYSQLIIEAPVEQSYVSTMMISWNSAGSLTSGNILPEKFELFQNYPNPFNPETKIKFTIPEASVVQLKLYDILGRQVDILIDQYLMKGTHDITYSNLNLSSGTYFYELRSGKYRDIKKMTLIK
ncbi:MAG: SBBP repeat-containing protein [Ignavibacteria bacterium]